MNADKREYYEQLYSILESNPPNVVYDGLGKTAQEITIMYNKKYKDQKTAKQISTGLTYFAKKGLARKKKLDTIRWLPRNKDVYDLLYE